MSAQRQWRRLRGGRDKRAHLRPVALESEIRVDGAQSLRGRYVERTNEGTQVPDVHRPCIGPRRHDLWFAAQRLIHPRTSYVLVRTWPRCDSIGTVVRTRMRLTPPVCLTVLNSTMGSSSRSSSLSEASVCMCVCACCVARQKENNEDEMLSECVHGSCIMRGGVHLPSSSSWVVRWS